MDVSAYFLIFLVCAASGAPMVEEGSDTSALDPTDDIATVVETNAEIKNGTEGSTGTTPSANVASVTESSNVTNATESSNVANATESSNVANATESSNVTNATESSNPTSVTESSNVTSATESNNVTNSTESSNVTNATESNNVTSGTETSTEWSKDCKTSRNLAGNCVVRSFCEFSTAAIDFTLYAPREYVKTCKEEEVCCPLEYIVPETPNQNNLQKNITNNNEDAFDFDDDD